ncbi:movement protein [Maize streak dwarfing virus]|uniref:Movement protein n=1 Tax=Maize streak dwarfing virus TaxID=2557970 RepID=A0A482G982_9GEMI|nr:movement protein [Maize streak dwarfing virus]QBO56210.1 movement protein [Maize streak dwarfing virus]
MGPASTYQVFTTYPDLGYQSPPAPTTEGEEPWFRVVFVLVTALVVIGIIYLSYRWFIRDVIILLRAKRQRSTEEIGFGNTPVRADRGRSGATEPGTGPTALGHLV